MDSQKFIGKIPRLFSTEVVYSMEKVSFVCTTYRRFTCVERIISQFNAQTYPNVELVIFNTDTEHPMTLGFNDDRIILINNSIDYVTQLPYTDRGQICRDAVTHTSGTYFMLADDDDVYLPWHIQQAVDKIQEVGKDAWKPERSFFALPERVELAGNRMEASIIVKMSRILELGFTNGKTGAEHTGWYELLRKEQQLDNHYKHYVPSYCFNWSDPPHIAGHKQSGNLNNPNNFEEHKTSSTDVATRPLMNTMPLEELYSRYYEYFRQNKDTFPQDLMEKYVNRYL